MSDTLAPSLWSDLLATPYERMNCWELVLQVFRRTGLRVSHDEGGWRRLDRPEPGCLVLMSPRGRRHVGVYLGGNHLLHATREAGTAVTRLSEQGDVEGFYWPDGTARPVDAPPVGAGVSVAWVDLFTGARQITRHDLPWAIPDGYRVLAGKVEEGGHVVVTATPGDPLSVAIGLAFTLASFAISKALSPPTPAEVKEESSPSFDLSGYLKNTTGVGIAQPVAYGEVRTGGHIISAFQRSDPLGRSVLYMLLFVSRGPIHSIAGLTSDVDGLTGGSIPSDITIDGNPASQYSCSVSVRLGGSNQSSIPGFRETVNATSYAYTLIVGTPFTHVGTEKAQALEAVIQFPLGLYNLSNTSGAIGPRTVTFTIRYRVRGTATWTSTTFTVTNARRGSFSRTRRVDGLSKDRYEVQFERISPAWPETAQDHESRSDLIEVHEITADQLSYPGKALLAIQAVGTDQLSGGIPQINCKLKGRTVFVWDGMSTTAPAFTEAWSDNPAWCALDLCINPQYGMSRGGRLTLDNIDLTAFLAWATLADTMVDDGRSGTTERARCDIVVDETRSGWELLNAIALSSWARIGVVGRKITPVVEAASAAIYPFSMGNVRDVEMTYLGKTERVNAVEVQYLNEETNYEADQASRFDDGIDLIVKESVQAVGVTRAAQAYRLAQYRLNYARLSKRRLVFTAGIESIHLRPGDVIRFSHDAVSYGDSGRLLGATATTAILDKSLTIADGSHIVTRASDDSILTSGIIVGPQTVARGGSVVVPAWSSTPLAGAPYAIGTFTSYYRDFRIISIETGEDLSRRLTCDEYSELIYSDDPGDIETFTDVMPDPRSVPGAVSNLHVQELAVLGSDGSSSDSIVVEWDVDEAWQSVDVWCSSEGTEWRYAGRSAGGRLQIDNVAGGDTLRISALPVSARGTHRLPEHGTIAYAYVRGRRYPPAGPQSVTAHVVNGNLAVCIEPPSDTTGIVGYEVRYGDTWAASRALGKRVPSQWTMACPFNTDVTLRVRSVTAFGVVSYDEATFVVQSIVPAATYVFDGESDETGAFSGTKTNTVVSGGNLVLDTGDLTGTYESRHTIGAAGSAYRAYTNLVAGLKDVALAWTDCAFAWNDPRWATVTWAGSVLTGNEVSENLRWEDCGFDWTDLPASCLEWSGPIDVFASLEPQLVLTDGADPSFDACATEKVFVDTMVATVTLNRPHTRYEPQVTAMKTTAYTVSI